MKVSGSDHSPQNSRPDFYQNDKLKTTINISNILADLDLRKGLLNWLSRLGLTEVSRLLSMGVCTHFNQDGMLLTTMNISDTFG